LEEYYLPEFILTDFEAQRYSKARIKGLELESLKSIPENSPKWRKIN
jgi:hypothetical protein